MFYKLLYTLTLSTFATIAYCQLPIDTPWHNRQRNIHYRPQGNDFIKVNGTMRFNRALYGTNTGFRVEAGDLPEFALYMPGMGGNFKFGLIAGNKSKWLIDADSIQSVYRAGSMLYEIRDSLLGKGVMKITVLALAESEGMIIKTQFTGVDTKVTLCWAFGGATGKRFSRDGDIGADPESSFYLQPGNCKDNIFKINENTFQLWYGTGKVLTEEERYEIKHLAPGEKPAGIAGTAKQLTGVVPPASNNKLVDATRQSNPQQLYQPVADTAPAISGTMPVINETSYFLIHNTATPVKNDYAALPQLFSNAEAVRQQLAARIKITTPDEYINTLGSALSIAADAIWEHPTYLHGAVAWRMRLPAWRGAYVADVLGWHNRARTHFSSYALSQVTSPASAPVVMDTALHLARHLEKIGTGMFTSGYICRNPNGDIRAHHYDMNLVFIDQLLTHFNWTGDTAFIKKMWPVLERHFAWEKRNFDADGDGLYDAYCCIWASDALQYSGGGVTHSSAYNYRANNSMAALATLMGEDATPYRKEADKILQAINSELWLPLTGHYAEYKDLLGLQRVHANPGLWTIYHAMDAQAPDAFKAFQSLRYIDTGIPHIPVQVNGLKDKNLFVLATSNWQPYTWSVNNVALAENLHAALAYWQGNRPEEGFHLWKSALVESMYAGSSPGGFQQLSFYDAVRGELYRDFADPVGMTGRTLVEGLFGIMPNMLQDTLTIKPGLPAAWKYATLQTPDIHFDFTRENNADRYIIKPSFSKPMHLNLLLRVKKDNIKQVTVNGKRVQWKATNEAVGNALVAIKAGKAKQYTITIIWQGEIPEVLTCDSIYAAGYELVIATRKAVIQQVYDPQRVLENEQTTGNKLLATVSNTWGNKTFFVQLKQGAFTWWQPLCFTMREPVEIVAPFEQNSDSIFFTVTNHTNNKVEGIISAGDSSNGFQQSLRLEAKQQSPVLFIPPAYVMPGSNNVRYKWGVDRQTGNYILNWHVKAATSTSFEKIDLSKYYNDKVTNIFKQQYLSPRPQSPTLQLPVQGIGNWCYPLTTAHIDDAGLRKLAGNNNEIQLPQGIPFSTPGDSSKNNIVFTSQWDNYPREVSIPVSGRAKHIYLLMAGSTNPMQSRFVNGEVLVHYVDGSTDTMALYNPVNWWPVEQDYMEDGFAFTTKWYRPLRFYLKQGIASTQWNDYTTIRGFSNRAIDGGAAMVLDFPLDITKELKSVSIHALANDVVIGLMSVTIVRTFPKF